MFHDHRTIEAALAFHRTAAAPPDRDVDRMLAVSLAPAIAKLIGALWHVEDVLGLRREPR